MAISPLIIWQYNWKRVKLLTACAVSVPFNGVETGWPVTCAPLTTPITCPMPVHFCCTNCFVRNHLQRLNHLLLSLHSNQASPDH